MNILNVATSPKLRPTGKRFKNVCWPKPKFGPDYLFKSEFLNGIRVYGRNPSSGIVAACTLMFQVGSRHEIDDDLGVSHFIRNASYTTGKGGQGFLRCREMQHLACYLTVTGDRQYTAFTLRCPATLFHNMYKRLLDCALNNDYPDWELEEVKKTVRADLARRKPAERCLDLAQRACFAGQLGNSIFCVKNRINGITSETIRRFIKQHYKPRLCSIGSDGAPYEEIITMATDLDCGRNHKPGTVCTQMPFARGGYEYYDTGTGRRTYVAICVPGAGSCDVRCCIVHALLAASCGLGAMHEGLMDSDRMLDKPLRCLTDDDDPLTDMCAFNISYSDTGIFGILIRSPSSKVRCATFRACEFLFNIHNITPEQVQIGKRRLEVGVRIAGEQCTDMSLNLALAASYCVPMNCVTDLCSYINCITYEEVLAVAQNIASKLVYKMALAVVGDVEATPHDGELRPC